MTFASRTEWRFEPNRLSVALEEYRRSGKPLFDLTNSNPTTCGFEYPQERIVAALSDRRILHYEPESRGSRRAREAIAQYYLGRTGFFSSSGSVDPEHIVITSSTSEAYHYIFRLLCEVHDEILVPAPSYPLFEYLAALADVRPVSYPLVYDKSWRIDFAGLSGALTERSKALLVVHPNNPTGSFVKLDEAVRLTQLRARRDFAVIADEVFLDYSSDSELQRSFAFESPTLTFALSGLSKISLLPQMKLAWMVVSGPDSIVRKAMERLELIGDTYLSASTPSQIALPEFLALAGNLQAQIRQRACSNLEFLDHLLSNRGAVDRLKREGGWYVVLRVPATESDEDLAIQLLETRGVLVHPGHFFDFPCDGFLVLSLIPPEDEFQEGVRRLTEFFEAPGS